MVLALTSTQENLWWGAIIGGLRRRARRGRAAHDPGPAGAHDRPARRSRSRTRCAQAADNTADTALIAETATRVEAVLAEGLEHHLFLGRVLDKVRT